MIVAQHLGRTHAFRAALGRLAIGGFGVIHPQRDVVHAVAVPLDMLGDGVDGIVRLERRGQHEANLILLDDIRRAPALPGLRSAVRHQLHAERRAIVIRRLPGIADVELDVIGSVERKKIRAGRWRFLCELLHIKPPKAQAPTSLLLRPPLSAWPPRTARCPRRCRSRCGSQCGSPNAAERPHDHALRQQVFDHARGIARHRRTPPSRNWLPTAPRSAPSRAANP